MPAEAGEAFAEVILKACAYDRHDRYESAEEFRMALEQILYPGQLGNAGNPKACDYTGF